MDEILQNIVETNDRLDMINRNMEYTKNYINTHKADKDELTYFSYCALYTDFYKKREELKKKQNVNDYKLKNQILIQRFRILDKQ
jgi:hypothetical protein